MKKSYLIFEIALLTAFMTSCGQCKQSNAPADCSCPIDSLNAQIQRLEEQNAQQEARIKDLEDELEDVIGFLNQQGY